MSMMETARLRVKERSNDKWFKLIGVDTRCSLRLRYFMASHPKRRICIRTKVQA